MVQQIDKEQLTFAEAIQNISHAFGDFSKQLGFEDNRNPIVKFCDYHLYWFFYEAFLVMFTIIFTPIKAFLMAYKNSWRELG